MDSEDETGEEQVGEIIHVRMRLLEDDDVLVQGEVQRKVRQHQMTG